MRVTKLYFMGCVDEVVFETLIDLRCVGLFLSLCPGAPVTASWSSPGRGRGYQDFPVENLSCRLVWGGGAAVFLVEFGYFRSVFKASLLVLL